MHAVPRGVVLAAVASAVMALAAAPALAHETEHVGDLEIVVGFGAEPAYVGQPNSVEVRLAHGGEPVTDLRPGDLRAEVTFGDATTEMDLEPNFRVGASGEPGDYRAWFVPSQPGPYTFRIVGEVDGEEVDESFTSGPDTFSEAIDPVEAAFPAVDAPTSEELATRIERESARTADAIEEATMAARDAADEASTATTFAIVGLSVGALGLALGLGGVAAARSARRAAA